MTYTDRNPDDDIRYMRRAIQIAEAGGRISTAPNPWVGCVIVKDGKIIAEGFHKRKGGLHAERNALANLGNENATGATAYVTLEPCCHHGATPPCTDALIEAKISRVVVAIGSDPDENVSGTGIAILKKAGILVDTGICEMEARESLRAYLHQRRTGQAYVVVKVGMSMNGKISFEDGTSQWITSESSREEAMKIRAQSQAILVGVNTVLVDNPKLTLRGLHANTDRGIIPFTRVVIDPTGKLAKPENSALNIVNDTGGPVLVFTTNPTLTIHHQIEWIYMQNIDVRKILTELAKRGIIQVLVEGGSTTLSHFFNEDLVNELVLFVAPTMIGSGGLSFYSSPFPNTIADRKKWRLAHVAPVRDGNGDIRIDYRFAY